MNAVVFDTSVVIDLLRNLPTAMRYAMSLAGPPACSEITRVEVLRGVRSSERRSTERLLGSFDWFGVDESIARRAGDLGRTWRRSHPGIATADLIIAATTEELGAHLATLNIRHFPMFRGLRPPYSP
ncbi:MAG TPA: type II toxin-antitoxin system VapC family toxin [Actinomycetota bacterium]|nr:type II toxin-antitoxin system VapC family toxin [Actinomycetota bacterium]